jgi:hypothetical protein
VNREYKLAATPRHTNMGPRVREILEYADGQQQVFAVVADTPDAMDILEAIQRAYQNGREDAQSQPGAADETPARNIGEAGQP